MANYVFPKVELPKIGRSNFNLDKNVFMSFAPSTIRCSWCRDVLPKDHFEVKLSAGLESMPMLSPMYGRWKARWAFFFEPYSNIYGFMDNNTRRSTESIIKSNLFAYTLPLGYIRSSYPSSTDEIYGQYVNSSEKIYSFVSHNKDGDSWLVNWTNRAKVASSSIWTDLGWPQGYFGYPIGGYEGSLTEACLGNGHVPIDEVLSSSGYQSFDSLLAQKDDVFIPNEYHCEHLHAVKPFGYLDIIRNYYVNNQEKRVPYIGYSDDVESFTNRVDWVDIEVLDYIMLFIRTLDSDLFVATPQQELLLSDYFIDSTPLSGKESLHSDAIAFLESWERSYFIPNGGCFLSPYSMDLNRGLMNAEQGNFQSYVKTNDEGRISMSQMYTANKLQELINVIDITGGRFSDWLNALWAVDIKGNLDKPIYLGSHTEYIATTDIVSPSSTESSLAGQQTGFSAGGFSREFRKISFNSDQYGVIYCIFNMVPEVMYSGGFNREDLKTKFTDIYNPRMAQLGYQDVPAKVLSAIPDIGTFNVSISYFKRYNGDNVGLDSPHSYYKLWMKNPEFENSDDLTDMYLRVDDFISLGYNPNSVVGRQVAWSEYMSDIDESRGYFAHNGDLSYWTLNRIYKRDVKQPYGLPIVGSSNQTEYVELGVNMAVSDYSTYVLPSEWNNLFADTSPDAENFRLFQKFNVFVKRAIPSRSFPRM